MKRQQTAWTHLQMASLLRKTKAESISKGHCFPPDSSLSACFFFLPQIDSELSE